MNQSNLWFWMVAGLLVLGLPLTFLYSRKSFWDQISQMGHWWMQIYCLVFPTYFAAVVVMVILRCHDTWSGLQAVIGVVSGITYICVTLTALITFVRWRMQKSRQ